ncbi:antirepressor regulating drug resistance protein [Owenweeksia hongkongensis DSM 17368]|uniref:Antirepressor regulating drug resistance protein n=1 Tax=Owenweeksia hongkongensis (strain DSM 17368 / CIP 108786 / JCM 12287 / NRRL B-23963 / UST20020801) TaxID=926562 RepID=G8R890_OWEHD|nr:M56 family metallopeptidase [Owenweeksia hongkongensis]AEV32458.1 antirepressor regulating drug resistance protein [Owenweeksia hongkongensis DSM 17368]
MNTLLIIRFVAFSGMLYLLYILVFKRFSFFAGNRWLLLSIPLISFVIPLVAPQFTNSVAPALATFQLEEIILNTTASPIEETTNSTNWLLLSYFAGFSIMTLLLIIGLAKAFQIKRKAVEKTGNIYYSSNISSAYTFFKSIIIPLSLKGHKDIDTIIKHEQVHVRQWHGLDNLYFQIITALAWFNPFIHLLAKELRQTHECLADEEAVEKTSREEYAHLLLSSAFGNELNFPLAAGTATPFFNSSLIKTRITMIYKSKTNRHFKWAYLALLPMLAAMTLYSCDKVKEEKSVSAQHEEKTTPISFADVEQVPLFEGCDANLSNDEAKACFQQGIMKYIGNNFEYPKTASKLGIEGKVYVQFIIAKDASIEDVEVLKGLSYEEDNIEQKSAVDEAHEEISKLIASIPLTAPAYKGGKKVAMSFIIPINMKLK